MNQRPPGYELRSGCQTAGPQCFPGLFGPEIPKNPKVVPIRSTATFDILGHILGQERPPRLLLEKCVTVSKKRYNWPEDPYGS